MLAPVTRRRYKVDWLQGRRRGCGSDEFTVRNTEVKATTTPKQEPGGEVWAAAHVSPLWESKAAHRNAESGAERAHIWRWAEMQPLIRAAISVRSMEAIERRVLSLVSPHSAAVGGAAGTTPNLNAGLQILMPGESARPHRHSMNALRFVLSGRGAVTVVDGKACTMSEGDLVITPGWCWHEHEHRGDQPIVWLDVLDASLHRYLGIDSFQPGPANSVPASAPDSAFASGGIVPVSAGTGRSFSPIFRYAWSDAEAALSAAPSERDGTRRIKYTNPLSGGPVMTLLDCALIEIPPGSETTALRTTANAVCAVIEGTGMSRVGSETLSWSLRDVFSLPHGNWFTHRADGGRARLFVVTDREVLRRLDLLKEEQAEPG